MDSRDKDSISKENLIRISVAAGLGNMIDFYEFFISATAAAIVWPIIFFGPLAKSPALATTLSIIAFGVGYITRPVGAFVFGHLGDTRGRITSLTLSILLTTVSVLGTGLLPTYASIGILAVILLFIFRLLLGMSLGGEFGGASVWVIEHAEAQGKRSVRGRYGSLLGSLQSIGIGAAGLAFTFSSLYYHGTSFLTIGWRIPYLAGAIIAIVGAIIRFRMLESPIFKQIIEKGKIVHMPALQVLKGRSGLIILGASFMYFFQSLIGVLFGGPIPQAFISRSQLVNTFGLPPRIFAPTIIALAYFSGALLGAIIGGIVSDYIGRKRTMLIAIVLSILFSYPYILLMGSGNGILALIATELMEFSGWIAVGVTFVWFAEMFPANLRYSGTGLTAQIGVLINGIISSIIIPSLITNAKGLEYIFEGSFIPGLVASIICLGILFLLPETKGKQLEM
ncbi:MFS transporter [Sulfolobus tengchongensis]|uniref:MFS transporter n=1 Tax=Sulfolobus tengchongensis TaxID=207809 RepID=A0AAX4L3E9_9CREN